MKTIGNFLVPIVGMMIGSLLLGGCFTQFALNDDQTTEYSGTPQTVITDPAPTIVIVQPVVPIWQTLPVAQVPSSPPSKPKIRDVGSQRPGSAGEGSGSGGSGANSHRTTGQARGGR